MATAHVLKLVWSATSILDGIAALRRMSEQRTRDPRPLLAIAMGETGALSRLLGAKVGAPFTFARLAGQPGSAPGQPTVDELRHLYRWRQQRSGTAVFGVAGWPVGHSLSHAVHNAGFEAVGFDGVYVPLPIGPGDEALFAALDALRAAPGLNLRGLSITSPHKACALRYVAARGGQLDALASTIGAVNTIVIAADGSLTGLNSDAAAAIDALCARMDIAPRQLRDRRVAVIGAGGAAAAVVAGLVESGAEVVIHNRSPDPARELAARLSGPARQVKSAPLDALAASDADIVIHCTPVGMAPMVDASLLPGDMPLGPRHVIFDAIYNPPETRLLERARLAGAVTVGGIEMFVRQAAIQFERFTGQPAPVALFREVIAARLAAGSG